MTEKYSEKKKKILIIDDEAVNRAVLEDFLSNLDYETFTAKNGDEGFEMLAKNIPDLVIMDINMPGKDGFQTLEEIKSSPEFSAIPVLFLSSFDRTNLKVKALEQGAVDYITRPFDKAELLARIRAALRRTDLQLRKIRKLEGNLSDLGLIELLQPFELGKKTATVNLKDIDGEVVLENGHLVFVRQGRFTGREALNRILLAEKGQFSVTFNQIPDNVSKQSMELMKAIMDSVADIDETKTLITQFELDPGKTNPIVIITPEMKKLQGAEKFQVNEGISLIDLIISLEGNLKDIVQSLLKMLKDNTLKLKPDSEIKKIDDNK